MTTKITSIKCITKIFEKGSFFLSFAFVLFWDLYWDNKGTHKKCNNVFFDWYCRYTIPFANETIKSEKFSQTASVCSKSFDTMAVVVDRKYCYNEEITFKCLIVSYFINDKQTYWFKADHVLSGLGYSDMSVLEKINPHYLRYWHQLMEPTSLLQPKRRLPHNVFISESYVYEIINKCPNSTLPVAEYKAWLFSKIIPIFRIMVISLAATSWQEERSMLLQNIRNLEIESKNLKEQLEEMSKRFEAIKKMSSF